MKERYTSVESFQNTVFCSCSAQHGSKQDSAVVDKIYTSRETQAYTQGPLAIFL